MTLRVLVNRKASTPIDLRESASHEILSPPELLPGAPVISRFEQPIDLAVDAMAERAGRLGALRMETNAGYRYG